MSLGTEMVRNVWGIEPTVLQQMRAEASAASAEPLTRSREMVARQAPAARAAGGSIGVLSLSGVILQRPSAMSLYFGGTACETFSAQLRDLAADDTVSSIVINCCSPGGSVFGVSELYGELMQAKVMKPVAGVINSQCGSAAYWLLSACSQLIITPGGECGSIGVYEIHEDDSEALKAAGIAITMISAGKYKVEGAPFGPLSAEAKGFKQSRVNEYYQTFTNSVARGRGVSVEKVRSGFGQGRMLGAKAALAEGMVDGIGTITEVVGAMARNIQAGNRNALVLPGRTAAAIANNARIREIEILEAGSTPPPREPSARLARMLAEVANLQRDAR